MRPTARINALAEHVTSPPKELDIEDLAKRAWPDAAPSSSGCSSGASACASCGSESGGSGGGALLPVPVASQAPPPAKAGGAPLMPEIQNAEQYLASIRNRKIPVHFMGEVITNWMEHPIIWPSVNCVAETYRLGNDDPELGMAVGFSGYRMSRFLHIAESAADLVKQSLMQRELGRRTGSCFQRCVGMDASNAVWGTTYDIDKKHGTKYHERFQKFMAMCQSKNWVVGGAMTDAKGDRSLNCVDQEDPDVFLHVHARKPDGTVVLRGNKMHQTGTLNSHWMICMPGQRLEEKEKDFAITCALPVDAPGLTYIYGRQSCDLRAMEGSEIDQGNAKFGGQETIVIFDDVEVPPEYVFMDGEFEFAQSLVERFTAYHRRSYICKAGLGDVMLGAAATIAEYNGAGKASHVKDKIIEIAYLNENIAGTALAANYSGKPMPAGNYLPDVLMANICKHNVTRFPYEIARLTQDLAGGLLVTLPTDLDFKHEVAGPLLEKYLKAKKGVSVEHRRRILRLIENMTMGRNAVGYLTESLHGAGSPQAQRVLIQRLMNLDHKKQLAKKLAGIE